MTTSSTEKIIDTIKAVLVEMLKTGNSAPRVYLRVRPNGTVEVSEEVSWCCSPNEHYKRVPHTLSLEVLKSERDHSMLSDEEIEECADNAEDTVDALLKTWEHDIGEWIAAGNLVEN
jgi:hypothetical protein